MISLSFTKIHTNKQTASQIVFPKPQQKQFKGCSGSTDSFASHDMASTKIGPLNDSEQPVCKQLACLCDGPAAMLSRAHVGIENITQYLSPPLPLDTGTTTGNRCDNYAVVPRHSQRTRTGAVRACSRTVRRQAYRGLVQ